ncbi:MAG: EamA family transporter, partial [Bacteroidales bacterium]|nr:EamA family transporter [Bacteroidales bacterium]
MTNKSRNNSIIVYSFAILAMLFWGLTFIWSKIVFEYYNPIATITLRLLISTVLLFFILLIFFRKHLVYPKGKMKLFFMIAL